MSKEAIRLILHQSSANYRKPETYENKMTYPLPPFSTVIGALHKACGYTDTHEMDISIQGRYGSLRGRVYRDYNFMNRDRKFDDRGILVKLANESMHSMAFTKVAESKKNNSSYERNKDIKVYDRKLLEEYQMLITKKQEIDILKKERFNPEQERLKSEKKRLAECRKQLDKASVEYENIKEQEAAIKAKIEENEKEFSAYEQNNFSIPYSRFRVLTTSIKQYEILNDIELIIHITAENRKTLEDIYEHVYDITSIGRSEDFVEIKSAEWTMLTGCERELTSEYSAYVLLENVRKEKIFTKNKGMGAQIIGTKYAMPKLYHIGENGQRVFDTKRVLYVSEFATDDSTEQNGIFVDKVNDSEYYIVNFV